MKITYYTNQGKEIKISQWIMIIIISAYLAIIVTCFTTIVVYSIYKAYEKDDSYNTGSVKRTELPGTGIGTGY